MRATRVTATSSRIGLLVVGLALVAGLGVAEILLRMLGLSYFVFERPDPVLGVSLRPHARAWYLDEGRAYVETNGHGFRDRERSERKPAGVYRVAVLGDSFVEARQVALADTFPALIEGMLDTGRGVRGGLRVEVMNFGVAGYRTGQQLLLLRHRVRDFEPDHVILAVFTENDIVDNSKALSPTLQVRPYFVLERGSLVLDTSFLESDTYRDRQGLLAAIFYATQPYSRLVQLVYRARRGLSRATVEDTPFDSPLLAAAVYREPTSGAWTDAWRVTERLITEMHRELTRRGVRFGLVTLSNPTQAHPDAARRRRFEQKLGVPDLFYPDRRLKALGERVGFSVLNLAPAFQSHATEHGVFLHGFENRRLGVGHWNEGGHRLAAPLIADWLGPLIRLDFVTPSHSMDGPLSPRSGRRGACWGAEGGAEVGHRAESQHLRGRP